MRRVLPALAASCALAACSHGGSDPKGQARGGRPVLVTLATAETRTMPVQIEAIGQVEPVSTVQVRALVAGQLEATHFTQGQDVHKGDRLFSLDKRPMEAALHQAEAALARDLAQSRNSSSELQRYQALFKEGGVSVEQFDQLKANASAQEETVAADRAAVANAWVQLSYADIRSPLDGRTGSLMVTPGNLVKANDTTPLVTINQMEPIYVTCSVPQQALPQIQHYQASGSIRVEAGAPDAEGPRSEGTLTFIDNAVDPTTGTVKLRGTFPNRDRHLWPGQFVTTRLTLAQEPNDVVVPAEAIQTGQKGLYVYLAKPDMTVEMRPVATDRTVAGWTVVRTGLTAGDRVVTDGQLQLMPGSSIVLKGSAGHAPAGRGA